VVTSDLDGLLDRHGLTRGDLVAAVHDLPEGPRDGEPLEGGWTVKDLICHVVAREEVSARAIDGFARGRPLARPEFVLDPAGFDARARETLGGLSWGKLWDRADEVRKALLAALIALYALPPERYAEGTPIRSYLELTTYEEECARQIEKWRHQRGI
jgi:hypothetical protein